MTVKQESKVVAVVVVVAVATATAIVVVVVAILYNYTVFHKKLYPFIFVYKK